MSILSASYALSKILGASTDNTISKGSSTAGDGSGEGIVREFGIDMYTLLYLKWITNKDLLYSTGNSAQYYVTT